MGQKITSDGSDSRRQINLREIWRSGSSFPGSWVSTEKCATFTARGNLFAWMVCDYSSPRHCQTFPKRINEDSRFLPFPGLIFSKQIKKKRLFILFRGFRWLQTRFGGWKFKSWQICFIANKIPVVVSAAGIIWHDFHAFVRSEISSSKKNILASRYSLASSLVIPWAALNTLFSSISVPIKVLRCTRHIVFDCSQLWQITDEIVERRWHRTVFVAISSRKTCFEAWNCSNGPVANVYRRFEHKKVVIDATQF